MILHIFIKYQLFIHVHVICILHCIVHLIDLSNFKYIHAI